MTLHSFPSRARADGLFWVWPDRPCSEHCPNSTDPETRNDPDYYEIPVTEHHSCFGPLVNPNASGVWYCECVRCPPHRGDPEHYFEYRWEDDQEDEDYVCPSCNAGVCPDPPPQN